MLKNEYWIRFYFKRFWSIRSTNNPDVLFMFGRVDYKCSKINFLKCNFGRFFTWSRIFTIKSKQSLRIRLTQICKIRKFQNRPTGSVRSRTKNMKSRTGPRTTKPRKSRTGPEPAKLRKSRTKSDRAVRGSLDELKERDPLILKWKILKPWKLGAHCWELLFDFLEAPFLFDLLKSLPEG